MTADTSFLANESQQVEQVYHPGTAFLDSSAACSRRGSNTCIHAGEPSLA